MSEKAGTDMVTGFGGGDVRRYEEKKGVLDGDGGEKGKKQR